MIKYPGHWLAGLQGQDKKNIEDLLENNNLILDRLAEICYNMSIESENSSDFDDPNWALRQASYIGFRKALKKISELCTPAKERDPVS